VLYHDPIFLWFFLPIFGLGYYALARRSGEAALGWICLSSLVFYAWTEPKDLVLLLWVTAAMMGGSTLLARRRSALILTFAAAAILAPLLVFKYANFIATVAGARAISGIPPLPIGLSFYTFQALAFLGVAYVGRRPTDRVIEGLAYLVFFPQLIAGPIVLPRELLPQLRRLRLLARPIFPNIAVGGSLFVLGFAKMTLIAEPASRIADFTFAIAAGGVTPDLASAWIGVAAYAVQIYFDFSAYSDMAIGLARCFGLRLPVNFFSPYRSVSLIEFWRRWHITLGRFLAMTLYVPLGGNRHGYWRQCAAIMATMTLGGLWHGAGYVFLVWGAMHGVGLAVAHGARKLSIALPPYVGGTLTFAFVVLAWVPFRSPDLATALRVWEALAFQGVIALPHRLAGIVPSQITPFVTFDGGYAYALLDAGGSYGLVAVIAGLLIAVLAPNIYQMFAAYRPALNTAVYLARYGGGMASLQVRLSPASAVVLASIFAVALLFSGAPQAFLYFQF